MKFSELLRVAWEGLVANKGRSLLTMLGVIIGVAAVIIMMAVSAGTEATISEQIQGLGANLIFVSPSIQRGVPGQAAQTTLVYSDAEAIAEQVPGVVAVSVEQNASAAVRFGGITLEGVSIIGTTPGFPSVRDVGIAEGRFFTDREQDRATKVAVLGPALAEELFGSVDPIGQNLTVETTRLTVIGIMAPKGIVGGVDWDARLYTPISVVFQQFIPSRMGRVVGDQVRQIYVQAESQEVIDNVILQITLLLARRHGVSVEQPDFTVHTQQDIIDTQAAATAAFRSLLGWVAGVSLVVGGIGIMNIMLVSVTERTREIGIRQAVGATHEDIRGQFLSEALMLSLVGGLIGVLCGVGGSVLFARLGEMRTLVVPSSIGLAFGSAAAVGIFFGYYPANRAAQLDPIASLRHE